MPKLEDKIYVYGYPDDKPNGDSATLKYEGSSHDPLLYKLKHGQIRSGFSGSPVLNLNNGQVCAMIRFTRNSETDIGGRAIPVSVILKQFPELIAKQANYHQQHNNWQQSLSTAQRQNCNNELILEKAIEEIDNFFVSANYKNAYKKFYQLCATYPDYKEKSAFILARHAAWEKNVIYNTTTHSEQDTEKQNIAVSFQMCLGDFKEEYLK